MTSTPAMPSTIAATRGIGSLGVTIRRRRRPARERGRPCGERSLAPRGTSAVVELSETIDERCVDRLGGGLRRLDLALLHPELAGLVVDLRELLLHERL